MKRTLVLVATAAVLAFGMQAYAGPYPGPNPAPVPGLIEAENYDTGGEGAAYHDTTTGNSGGAYRADDVDIAAGGGSSNYKVMDIAEGEWLTYTINAPQTGLYRLTVRYSSANANTTFASVFHVEIDGTPVTGAMAPVGRGSNTSFADFTTSQFGMAAGDHVLKFSLDALVGSGMEIDYFRVYADPNPGYSDWAAYYRFEIDPDRALTSSPAAMTALIDDSANQNNGTPGGTVSSLYYSGGVTFPASRANTVPYTGLLNNKYVAEFVAADGDYFSVPHSASLSFGATRSFTIQAFVQVYTVGDVSGTRCWLVSKKAAGPDSGMDYGFLVGAGDLALSPTWSNLMSAPTGQELALVFGSAGGLQVALSTLKVPTPVNPSNPPWYYVLASYDAVNQTVVFMVDHVADVITGVVPGNGTNTGPLYVGAHMDASGAAGEFLDANVDELLISTTPKMPVRPSKKWFWSWEGGEPQDVFNADGKKVMDFYHVRWDEPPYEGFPAWFTQPIVGEPGNMEWYSWKAWERARFFYDQTYYEGATRPINNSIAPDDRGTGSTLSMRFKIPVFTATDPTKECKWIRIFNYLTGVTAGDNFMQWNVMFDNLTSSGNIVMQNGAFGASINDPARLTPPVSDKFHKIWQISRVEGANVRCKVWFDGTLIQNYLRNVNAGSRADYYIMQNDNNRRHKILSEVDYMRFAVDKDYYFGDLNMDGSVDLLDFSLFSNCFNGPNNPPPNANCDDADFDGDLDVDIMDFTTFAGCFNGPNNPPACK